MTRCATFALIENMVFTTDLLWLETHMARSGKERIIPPSKKTDSEAGKALKKGSGIGGRVLSDAAVAKKQGVKRLEGR